MRQGRLKAPGTHRVAYYHCISRVVDRQFIFSDVQKERFVGLMREYEEFCAVRVVTFSVMSNHFHVLVEVPKRPDQLPTDEELCTRIERLSGEGGSGTFRQTLERLRRDGHHQAAEELRARIFARMWDISGFMKLLKQRFTQSYNRQKGRKGTLWEERFKSVLIEGAGEALASTAAYIDLNSVRAKLVEDPKDYRWCGYSEAMAGKRRALEGLQVVVAGAQRVSTEQVKSTEVLPLYRMWLFGQGEQNERTNSSGHPLRPGFSREAVAKVLEEKGRVQLSEYLRLRVRYFADGAVLGTQEFVDEIFHALRHRFGAKRKDGARRLRGVESTELFALRDLRVRAVQYSPVVEPEG
jgi:REP element-mobilizing transposase RayT